MSKIEAALEIPEVLSRIIGQADSKDQTVAARTSKAWNEAALNCIWRRLDSIVPLLKILSPLRRIPYPSMWELEHLPCEESWARFNHIAHRVRKLAHHDEQTIDGREHSHLAFNVFMDLASMGPKPLLPNLRELEWHVVRPDTPFSLVFLFLNPNLRQLSLEVDITDIPARSFNNLLQLLPTYTPLLTHLYLYTHVSARDIQTELARCVGRLRSLEVVGLPPNYHTDIVVNALAVAPALLEMRTGWLAAAPGTPEESRVEFQDGWFRTMERLDFEAPPGRAISLLSNQFRPQSLTRIRLTTGLISDNDQLERFLAVIATTIPNLTLLSLNMWSPHLPIPPALVFSTFRPILQCRKLTYFELGHNHPMQLDEGNILEMAEAWPELKDLTICEDPVIAPDTPPGLSLSVLPLFAEKFPALRELGLFLDGTPVPPFASPPVFRHLRELNVGTSRLEPKHATSVALYISDICHNAASVVKGKSAWHVSGVWDLEEDDTPYLTSSQAWAEVGKIVKSVHQHRLEKEKSRQQAVQRQARAMVTGMIEQIRNGGDNSTLEAKVKELEAALRTTLGEF